MFVCNLEYIEVTKEKEKMKNDFEILERKFKELNLEKKLQNEEFQKVKKEKMEADLQKKESEKLLNREKANVSNLEKELLILKEELQSKTGLLGDYKLSMKE